MKLYMLKLLVNRLEDVGVVGFVEVIVVNKIYLLVVLDVFDNIV